MSRAWDDPLARQWQRALRKARLRRGIKVAALARRLGISDSMLSMCELGQRRANYTLLINWSKALGAPDVQ